MLSIDLILLGCLVIILVWGIGVSLYTYFSIEKDKPSFAKAGYMILWGSAVTAALFIIIILIFKI